MAPKSVDGCFCKNSTRYVVLGISTAALSFVIANSLSLNFTVICMYRSPHAQRFLAQMNSSRDDTDEMLYSVSQRSWLFSATAVGNLLGSVPITHATRSIGVRHTFMVYGLISGVATLLMPLFVSVGIVPVILLRIMQGFGQTIAVTSLGSIVSAWSPLESTGFYVSVLSTPFQLGPIMVMPLSGVLCDSSMGWPMVYYLLSAGTFITFAAFFYFYADDPKVHRNVSAVELGRIKEGKQDGSKQPVPYREIVTDIRVIAVLVSAFGGSLGIFIMYQYGPTYLSEVLGFDSRKTGAMATIPYLLALVVKFIAGPLSDRIVCLSQRGRIIFFNTLSQLPICFCLVLMSFVPSSLLFVIQIAYSLVNAFSGLNAVGVAKCIQLIARHHAHFIMTLMNVIVAVTCLIIPPVVALIATENTRGQWAVIFCLIAGVVTFTFMFFNFMCAVEPRSWAIVPDAPQPSVAWQAVAVKLESPDSAPRIVSSTTHNLAIAPADSFSEERPPHVKVTMGLPRPLRVPCL